MSLTLSTVYLPQQNSVTQNPIKQLVVIYGLYLLKVVEEVFLADLSHNEPSGGRRGARRALHKDNGLEYRVIEGLCLCLHVPRPLRIETVTFICSERGQEHEGFSHLMCWTLRVQLLRKT